MGAEQDWFFSQTVAGGKILETGSKVNVSFDVFIGVGDSLGKMGKAATHLEALDYHRDYNESTKKN
ncbi:MAG: hypothetical protein NTW32_08045 [Chloroflexi bacterium]|nr:hypothetical protein [Chloroflexota bacterium]